MRTFDPLDLPEHIRSVVREARSHVSQMVWQHPDLPMIVPFEIKRSFSEQLISGDAFQPVRFGNIHFYQEMGRVRIDHVEVPEEWL